MLTMTVCLAANAQLSIQDVCKKSVAADNIAKGFKCKAAMKFMGVGESMDIYYVNKQMRMDTGDDVAFYADKVLYEIDKKEKTITIGDGETVKMLLLPYLSVQAFAEADPTVLAKSGAKLKKNKKAYVISCDKEGANMTIEIDANTFHLKSMKLKKNALMSITMSYSNAAPFHNESFVKYNKNDYAGYKVVDEREKKATKKKK